LTRHAVSDERQSAIEMPNPAKLPAWADKTHMGELQDVRHLPARAVEELEKFFEATDALEDKKLEFLAWRGPARATRTIKRLSR
jgi:inorganic pyrophosphatase